MNNVNSLALLIILKQVQKCEAYLKIRIEKLQKIKAPEDGRGLAGRLGSI